MPVKLQVGLKMSDQSRTGSHFNSQNTHSHFHSSQLAFYLRPEMDGACRFTTSYEFTKMIDQCYTHGRPCDLGVVHTISRVTVS